MSSDIADMEKEEEEEGTSTNTKAKQQQSIIKAQAKLKQSPGTDETVRGTARETEERTRWLVAS